MAVVAIVGCNGGVWIFFFSLFYDTIVTGGTHLAGSRAFFESHRAGGIRHRVAYFAIAIGKGRVSIAGQQTFRIRRVAGVTIAAREVTGVTFSMNLLPGIIRGVMAFAAKCLNVAGKQTAMDTIVRGMAGKAFHSLKGDVENFFAKRDIDILLVAHLAETDLLGFFGRRPQHTGFIGAMGIVTIPALPIRDRKMH